MGGVKGDVADILNANAGSFGINLFGGSDAGTFQLISNPTIPLASGNVTVGELVTGQTIEVLATAGSFGFDGLEFTTFLQIPEPSTVLLTGVGFLTLLGDRRRLRF